LKSFFPKLVLACLLPVCFFYISWNLRLALYK